jgi:hypothetical protein
MQHPSSKKHEICQRADRRLVESRIWHAVRVGNAISQPVTPDMGLSRNEA